MTITSVQKDTEDLSMTLAAEFDAPTERVWQLWDDPRQLERWWGPPTYPATVTSHDLRPGGRVEYHMTGPEGISPRVTGRSWRPSHRIGWFSTTALPMTTARRTPTCR